MPPPGFEPEACDTKGLNMKKYKNVSYYISFYLPLLGIFVLNCVAHCECSTIRNSVVCTDNPDSATYLEGKLWKIGRGANHPSLQRIANYRKPKLELRNAHSGKCRDLRDDSYLAWTTEDDKSLPSSKKCEEFTVTQRSNCIIATGRY
ncbi:hypothetical protein CEXT_631131 [Caerostris extrusa]|uniref:Uncharacterized protein n=1 Tax=Caerostris extrusa TaxID=172846 RepID=A0AAV4SJD7_CAEEX|nr:hypothetical protein CEXT_631131 [Caerostris extrusa]